MEIARFTPPRILLVERDPSLASLLCEVLNSGGYLVSFATSLEAVPAQLEQEAFALVLADVYAGRARAGSFMPAHRLRRLAAPTPVGLLMTVPAAPEEARRAGFAFVLPMPFELADLLAEVAQALQLPLRREDQQRVQVVERFFDAREAEDWSALLALCTEAVDVFPPTPVGLQTARRLRGQAAVRTYFAATAQATRGQTFLHRSYAVVPHGLIVRYVRYWTTPEGARRREAKVGFFHFQGTQLCQVGLRPQLAARPAQEQVG
jgi:CheY-like chemotaxis protein/ketosteroid isomerase-like protein